MKFRILTFLLLAIILKESDAQPIARVEVVKIQSKALNQERDILVYTPADYDYRTNESFDVIYVFDSQNREMFDYTSSIVSFLSNSTKSYIVVGITSPYNATLDYSRNNDLLPVLVTEKSKQNFSGKYYGNADNFLNYVALEVVPYVNSNYRTLNHSIAVGHSLGASFVLYSMLKKTNLFASYIAISPNLAYDDEVLGNQIINFDYTKVKNPTYIFISNASEGINSWKEWKPAREKVYSFFRNSLKNPNIMVKISEFPNSSHWGTFPQSLTSALEYYFQNIQKVHDNELSVSEYEVKIRVKVPKSDDTIYIAGNQIGLGSWDPGRVKMKRLSDYERELSLKLRSPAQFKFTRGSWDAEAEVVGAYGNITIKPESKNIFTFEVK